MKRGMQEKSWPKQFSYSKTTSMDGLSPNTAWIFVSLFGLIFLLSLILNITLLKLSSSVLGGSLRHPKFTHFLTSLLLGNLLVTLSGLPAWVTILASNNTSESWRPVTETTSEIFYYTLDIFHSLLVFIHIIVLMVERLYAIGWSIQHRISPDHHDYVICFLIWLTAGICTTSAFLLYYFYHFKELSLVAAAASLPLPVLLSCILFVVIIVKKNNNFTTEMRRIEFRIAVVVTVLMFFCVALHAPLHVVHVLIHTFSTRSIPYLVTIMSLRCVQYASSVAIPVVVVFGVAEFRSEMHMCCFKCCSINEHSRNDMLEIMDMPRLDGKCILTNASRYTPKEQVELSFTNEVHS